MPNVKTNAVLPKGEENGLADIAGALVAEGLGRSPVKLRAVIAIVAPRRVNVDTKTGEELATVEIRRVEVLLPVDLGAAEKLLRRALESRSGQTTLELELEDEIRQAFDQMLNPDSPEDPDEGGDGQGGKGGKPRGKS
jgi:hypothetical protein